MVGGLVGHPGGLPHLVPSRVLLAVLHEDGHGQSVSGHGHSGVPPVSQGGECQKLGQRGPPEKVPPRECQGLHQVIPTVGA